MPILDNIEIKPSKETKVLGKRIRGVIKDSVLRNKFYNYIVNSDLERNGRGQIITDYLKISDNDKIDRFLELHKESGNPTIHVISPKSRPHYIGGIPFYNDIYSSTNYYGNDEDNANIITELSHAYQFNNRLSEQLELKPNLGRAIKQGIVRMFKDDEAYNNVGNYEYDAHSIIEPTMHSYISGKTNNFEDDLRDLAVDIRTSPDLYGTSKDYYADYTDYNKSRRRLESRGSKTK